MEQTSQKKLADHESDKFLNIHYIYLNMHQIIYIINTWKTENGEISMKCHIIIYALSQIYWVLIIISRGCFLEGMILKLKLQYFGYLMRRVDSLEKTLMLGGIGDRRKRGWQRMRWLDGITKLMDVSLSELREMVIDREAWRAAIHEVSKSRTWLSDWTELILNILVLFWQIGIVFFLCLIRIWRMRRQLYLDVRKTKALFVDWLL